MTVLDPSAGYVTLINIFTVDPDNADKLLTILSDATQKGMRHIPGFISANLHLSQDKRHIANYAQWRSQADLDAMMKNSAAREHMQAAAKVATSFEAIYYELMEVHSAGDRA